MNISERLSVLRRGRGWSQEALAEKLGVSRQAVSQWESAQAVPELENLVAVADLFRVTLDDLVRDRLGGDCGHPNPAVGTPDDDAVTAFLVRAKKATSHTTILTSVQRRLQAKRPCGTMGFSFGV